MAGDAIECAQGFRLRAFHANDEAGLPPGFFSVLSTPYNMTQAGRRHRPAAPPPEDSMADHDGFELLRQQHIPEMKMEVRFYRHIKTGAQVLSVINDDENKVFGISFRTPPEDSTGVAHILEHSVLCGSRKFPVKEPFVELLKGSLKTFLNAFTYPDKTCYPVASQNLKDFYNLIDVYLDAVFYPLITPYIFQQEGWHYELDSPDGPISYKGVVYNEMRGAYSSPDNVLAEYSQQSLFPDITYGLDSGGHPGKIPDLTYEGFKNFHEKHYHPSNAYIFFYGDDDPGERLHFLRSYLDDFTAAPVDSSVGLQPAFDKPRLVRRRFAAGAETGEGQAKKPRGMITLNWLLPETSTPELNLSLRVLQHILIGMPGSPLRKALIDSGLGDDLAGTGLENELRQAYFSTGLKGIDTDQADRVERLVLDTLAGLSKQGIPSEIVDAALNTVEFRLRENNAGSYPRGLVLMLRALSTWLYDGDPAALLAFEAPLAAVKASAAASDRFFEKMIERHFLDNPHRTTLVMEPDLDLASREEAEERERLADVRAAMKADELRAVFENTLELRRRQEAPDSPEALATIPNLKRTDLEKTGRKIPVEEVSLDGSRLLLHDITTNGIFYLDLGLDLHALPQRCLPYVPLFGRALLEMGTEAEDYVSLSTRISRETGGIRPDLFTSAVRSHPHGAAWLILRGKSTVPRAGALFSILRDVLLTVKLDDRERFRQMVLEEKARQEQRLIPNGHQMVNLRLRAHFGVADWAGEQTSGISYLMFLRKLAADIDKNWPGVLSTLEELRAILVNRTGMLFNATVDGSDWGRVREDFERFVDTLPARPAASNHWRPAHTPEFEGLIIPSQVNYVGKGFDIYRLGYRFDGSIQVITGYLRNSWLWEQVRVQGGAYGAMCLFDRISGIITFVSYRDPNLERTIEAFDRTADFLRNVELSEEELTKAIIGAIGTVDTYLLPDARGYVSMLRAISGDTEEDRQRMRDQILATTARDFREFADVLDAFKQKGIVKVLGSKAAVGDSLAGRGKWLKLLNVM